MLLAASTQRTVGFVILAIVLIGGLLYIYFNIRGARDEIGSEVELASNRRPSPSDEEFEGKKLDLALGSSLVLLVITAVTLPLYWLGEPGRHEGRDLDTWRIFGDRGEEIYLEGAQCVNCHGPDGAGGAVSTAITSESGGFIAQVNWKAPALDTVLSRFTEDEVLHTLNFGRNGVMPAWGSAGGGPLTDQQLEEIMFYLRRIQLDQETMRGQLDAGVMAGAENLILNTSEDPWAVDLREAETVAAAADLAVRLLQRADFGFACSDDIAECVASDTADALVSELTEAAVTPLADAVVAWFDAVDDARNTAEQMALSADSSLDNQGNEALWRAAALEILATPDSFEGQRAYLQYGEVLFTNQAASGTFSCARCHTYGWSFDATSNYTVEANGRDGGLFDEYEQGGGFFGPNLTGGSTLDQFESAASHAKFIAKGQTIGAAYGRGGSGGNGQMPGFGPSVEDAPIGPGLGAGSGVEFSYPAMLTEDQIDAIVAFERNL